MKLSFSICAAFVAAGGNNSEIQLAKAGLAGIRAMVVIARER